MSDLIAFLKERTDEDEAAARESYYEGQRWITEEEGVYRWPDDELVHMADRKADARHIARHDPAHVLRKVAADRAILAAYEANDDDAGLHLGPYPRKHGEWDGLRLAVRLLAAIWSDHPDYDPAWAVTVT